MRGNSIPEKIICTASRLELLANRYVFGPIGMTSTSMKILGLIKTVKDITPRELMDYTGGTKSNISQRLNFLEKNGLITRSSSAHSEDKRKVSIRLTKTGEAKFRAIKKRVRKAKLALEKYFEPEELEAHYKFIKKLHIILDTKEEELAKIFRLSK